MLLVSELSVRILEKGNVRKTEERTAHVEYFEQCLHIAFAERRIEEQSNDEASDRRQYQRAENPHRNSSLSANISQCSSKRVHARAIKKNDKVYAKKSAEFRVQIISLKTEMYNPQYSAAISYVRFQLFAWADLTTTLPLFIFHFQRGRLECEYMLFIRTETMYQGAASRKCTARRTK